MWWYILGYLISCFLGIQFIKMMEDTSIRGIRNDTWAFLFAFSGFIVIWPLLWLFFIIVTRVIVPILKTSWFEKIEKGGRFSTRALIKEREWFWNTVPDKGERI